MRKVKILNKDFLFYESDNIWLAPLDEIGHEATFEVYNKNLDVSLISKILIFLNSEEYSSFELKSKDLLFNLSVQFWGKDLKNTRFHFSGITIRDFQREIDFQVFFHMSSNSKDFGDDFANWIIDVKDFKIVGAYMKLRMQVYQDWKKLKLYVRK